MKHHFFSLGDNSLTVEFGNEISVELNNQVLELANFFDRNPFEGFVESIAAYSSLTIFYDLKKVRKSFNSFPTAFDAISNLIEKAYKNLEKTQKPDSRLVEIPVCFDDEFAPDLNFVATQNNLSTKDVINIFLGRIYRVFMLGFLPGFAYMGEIDERIATSRKSAPRQTVPIGSVGIAGKQTGIYPLESPGGWQIIGKTPQKLFTPEAENPTFFRVGDSVKFYEIKKEVFDI